MRKALEAHGDRGSAPPPPSPPSGTDEALDPRAGAQCETYLAIDPNDEQHVVGVAIDFSPGYRIIRWYTSFDGGASWATGTFPLESGFNHEADPTVVITPSGTPVITLIQAVDATTVPFGVYSYRSLDGGLTWEAGVVVDLYASIDKPVLAVDLSNGPHRGQIAVTWKREDRSGRIVWAATSNDDGASFGSPVRVSDFGNTLSYAAAPAYGPNSELWVMWSWAPNLYLDKSLDGGLTFGRDKIVGTYIQVPLDLPNTTFEVSDVFSIAVDRTAGPYSGSIYILYHNWEATSPPNASVHCLSSTNGRRRNDVNVNVGDTTNADQFDPVAQVDAHGNVDVAFYDRRLDPNNTLLWTWVARSSDGGATWAEFQASDVGWDSNKTDNTDFIGDYIGVDVSEHAVRPIWADGRTGSLDVMSDALHLDVRTSPSEISAATGGAIAITVNVGPNEALDEYWLVASFGTSPGIDVGPVHLPLVMDSLFLFSVAAANGPNLLNSHGFLDATGSALVTFDSGGPFDPVLIGTELFFAALVSTSVPIYATNATLVSLVP